MITIHFSEREQFYYIVKRVKEERKLSWCEAWKIVARADFETNERVLFETFRSFNEWRKRYVKTDAVSQQIVESEMKTEEMHDFYSISEEAYIQELLITTGVHVNQLDGAGRSWLDVEEEQREKRINTLLQEYGEGKRVGKDPARKRKRTQTLRKGVSTGDACAKPPQNTARKNRHERARQTA